MPDVNVETLTNDMRKHYGIGSQYDFYVSVSRNYRADGDGQESRTFCTTCRRSELQGCIKSGINYFIEPTHKCSECNKENNRRYSSFCSKECETIYWERWQAKEWGKTPKRIKFSERYDS